MACYVQLELADGVAADGTRVVSTANLERTQTPPMAIPAPPGLPPLAYEGAQAYGLGWLVEAYKGQPIVSHSGGKRGFAADPHEVLILVAWDDLDWALHEVMARAGVTDRPDVWFPEEVDQQPV
jgi:hypothetical protein